MFPHSIYSIYFDECPEFLCPSTLQKTATPAITPSPKRPSLVGPSQPSTCGALVEAQTCPMSAGITPGVIYLYSKCHLVYLYIYLYIYMCVYMYIHMYICMIIQRFIIVVTSVIIIVLMIIGVIIITVMCTHIDMYIYIYWKCVFGLYPNMYCHVM